MVGWDHKKIKKVSIFRFSFRRNRRNRTQTDRSMGKGEHRALGLILLVYKVNQFGRTTNLRSGVCVWWRTRARSGNDSSKQVEGNNKRTLGSFSVGTLVYECMCMMMWMTSKENAGVERRPQYHIILLRRPLLICMGYTGCYTCYAVTRVVQPYPVHNFSASTEFIPTCPIPPVPPRGYNAFWDDRYA